MKKLPVSKVTHWKAPSKNDVRVLGMPNIPHPLQGPGCQPRTIAGAKVWDQMRKKCYEDAGYKCEVCGYEHQVPADLHCLERGTEVLCVDGWKPIENVTTLDTVAQFTKEGKIEFVHPLSTVSRYETNIVRIGYKKGFAMRVSDKHRVLVYDKRHKLYRVFTAESVTPTWPYYVPASGNGTGDNELTDDERLMIAIQADGSLSNNGSTGYCFSIRVKKPRKVERLKDLISKTSFRYTEVHDRDYTGFLVWTKDKNCKRFWECFDVNMGKSKASAFIDELVKWDGWEGTRNGVSGRCYYSSEKDNIDFVQAVAAQANLGTHVTIARRADTHFADDHLIKNAKPSYNLEIKKRGSYGMQTMLKTIEPYNDDVFCITVPSSFFVARTKGGDVFITGNCHEVFSTDYEKGEAVFERTICLCKKCHIYFIHSGRALTMYKHGDPLYSKEKLLEGAEHGFKLISEYNKTHKRKIYVFSTIADYLKEPELKAPMEELINRYHIEFYKPVAGKKQAAWGDWKLIWNGKEYKTPYADSKEWEEKMEDMNKKSQRFEMTNRMKGGVFDELDKLLKGE